MSSFISDYVRQSLEKSFASFSVLEQNEKQDETFDQQEVENPIKTGHSEPLPTSEKVETTTKKMLAGSTMHKLEDENDVKPLSWKSLDGTSFKVRVGPNYAKLGNKDLSGEAFYDLVASDLLENTFDDDTKLDHIVDHVELPPDEGWYDPKCPLPRIIVCNVQVISKPPKLFGKPDPDVGCSIVMYFHIKKSTMEKVMQLEDASAALKLLHKFVTEWHKNADIRRRFKVIGVVGNVEELGLSRLVQGTLKTYNGKPAIVNKAGAIYSGNQHANPKNSYLEVDIKIKEFAMLAQKMLCTVREIVPKTIACPAFVIQGESDEELPECVFGCAEYRKLDFNLAQKVCIPPMGHNIHKAKTFQ